MLLTTSRSETNLEVALEVRGDHPEIIVVMRFAEQKLAKRLEKDFGITAVLSPAVLAAGYFIDAAMLPIAKAANPHADTTQTSPLRILSYSFDPFTNLHICSNRVSYDTQIILD